MQRSFATINAPVLKPGETYHLANSPVHAAESEKISGNLNRLIELMSRDECFMSFYDELSEDWNADRDDRRYYGGFFKNYYRNREDDFGYDDKIVWQASSDFLDYFELGLSMLGYRSDPVFDLVLQAQSFLSRGIEQMRPTILGLCKRYPELEQRLLEETRELPCTIRFMRYRSHERLGTHPHVDKTVMSSIIWNSDPNEDQRLAFPLYPSDAHDPSRYHPVGCKPRSQPSPAYLFWGAALSEAGYPQPASPHAVLPVLGSSHRYSVAVFWLLPDLDLSDFKTAVPIVPEVAEMAIAA